MSSKVVKRVAAVTGGTRGIGRAIAEIFHARGYAVAVCSRSTRERLLSPGILHCRLDVSRREQAQRFVTAVVKRWGALDVFVNSAGVSRWRALKDVNEDFMGSLLDVNLRGTLWGCAAASSAINNGGCIINISSLAGKRGSPNNSVYCATKFAVNGMTQALAKELGPRGIRVNAVCPVYVRTEHLLASLREPDAPPQGQEVERYLASFATSQTALGRLPTPEEVAEVVYFLASPAASAVTGQCLNVDCGTFPQ